MIIFLILFVISLVGIILLIKQKMSVLTTEDSINSINLDFGKPFIEEVKYATIKKTKRYGYILLFISVRMYVLSSKFVKDKSKNIADKVISKLVKKDNANEQKETSNFLKMVADYKRKIKKIHHKIKEEEGI